MRQIPLKTLWLCLSPTSPYESAKAWVGSRFDAAMRTVGRVAAFPGCAPLVLRELADQIEQAMQAHPHAWSGERELSPGLAAPRDTAACARGKMPANGHTKRQGAPA
jgi:hypothetical protein